MAENIDAERATLLPCPFCGDAMKLETIDDVVTGPGQVFVQCDCGATSAGGSDLDEAIASWNRRTPSASIGEDGLPELPPLPMPLDDVEVWLPDDLRGDKLETRECEAGDNYFSNDQMRQYARDAIAADRRQRSDMGIPASAPQAAQGVKTWQERMPEHVKRIGSAASQVAYMEREIADLRAQLARQSQGEPYALDDDDDARFPNDTDVVVIHKDRYWKLRGCEDVCAALGAEPGAAPPLSSEQQAENGENNVG